MSNGFSSILKVFIVALIFFGLAFLIFYLLTPPADCTGDNCDIQTSCDSNQDCIISCGCNCVSSTSECSLETQLGSCSKEEINCVCENNVCTYNP